MVDTLLRFVRRFYGRLTSKNEKRTVVWRDLYAALSPEVGITLRGIVLMGYYQASSVFTGNGLVDGHV